MVFCSANNTVLIQAAIAFPVEKTYTYKVPPNLQNAVEIGKRALVPFNGRAVTGYILETFSDETSGEFKEILDIPDTYPLFTPSMIPFFQWIADYYLYPLGEVITAALPGGLNMFGYTALHLLPAGLRILDTDAPSDKQRLILAELKKNPARLYELKQRLSFSVSHNMIYAMEKAGWIERKTGFRHQTANYKVESYLSVSQSDLPKDRFYDQRKKVIEYIRERTSVRVAVFKQEMPEYAGYLRYLIAKGYVVECRQTVRQDIFGEPIEADTPPVLNGQQASVMAEIEPSIGSGFAPFLLSGVTGSGKTEIYMRLAAAAIEQGLGVIALVPEIALITQVERRFRARFGESIAVLHSGMTNNQRFQQWMEISQARINIVIGARSAIFAPINNPGLIIVDEEHDSSYKQETNFPYHARDIAVLRAKLADCTVVLGSATPSVQSFYNVHQGKYRLVSLENRIQNRPLPDITIINLKEYRNMKGIRRLISTELESAIRKTLDKGEQVLIFLNRRGFASFPVCAACGEPLTCKHCDMTLTLHQTFKAYKCHKCGFALPSSTVCQTCGSSAIKRLGFGTEKIESMLQALLPQAVIARMDRDTTSRKGSMLSLLKDVQNRRINILIGTQMVAKGHDYPHITLVGVICADLTLNFPDFHSGERTFQLLAQVAGRAGRGDSPGKVILQTYNPDHFCILAAKQQDFNRFYQQEIIIRQRLEYPPFSRLIQLRISSHNKDKTRTTATALAESTTELCRTNTRFTDVIQILGPIESPVFKVKNRYRMQIQLKSKNSRILHDFLKQLKIYKAKLFTDPETKITIDVDPCAL